MSLIQGALLLMKLAQHSLWVIHITNFSHSHSTYYLIEYIVKVLLHFSSQFQGWLHMLKADHHDDSFGKVSPGPSVTHSFIFNLVAKEHCILVVYIKKKNAYQQCLILTKDNLTRPLRCISIGVLLSYLAPSAIMKSYTCYISVHCLNFRQLSLSSSSHFTIAY